MAKYTNDRESCKTLVRFVRKLDELDALNEVIQFANELWKAGFQKGHTAALDGVAGEVKRVMESINSSLEIDWTTDELPF